MRLPSNRLRRGSTLIELLLVIVLQVIIVGAVATLYLFTIQQCGQATAAVGSIEQANGAMDAIATTVRQSMVCATQSAGGMTGLRCTLPANGMDGDGDGTLDTWYPDKFGADGKATYTKGVRVWYYQSDGTGTFGTAGTILWRATRTDDSKPTAADVDSVWARYYGAKSRYPLIDTLTYTVSGASAIVTVAISASAAARAPDVSGSTAATKDKQAASLSRAISWRTDFE